jgi:RNA polymerase sigma factor (TIGR02999 family)
MSAEDTLALLRAGASGDEAVVAALFARLYDELRQIAHHRLRGFRPGETLNTTALVHEAYVRLVDPGRAQPADRAHFLALASRAMRYVLVDHARAKSAAKRGGGADAVSLDDAHVAADDRAFRLLHVHDALTGLAEASPRLAQVVELRFFGGLSHEEVAAVTGRSVPTVKRDWTRARAWLHRAMQDAEPA